MLKNIYLLTQYYKVKFSIDITGRQKEIDEVLKRNCNNTFITNIYLLLEEDYDLNYFLTEKEQEKIIKIIISKRMTFYDAFNFYNTTLSGSICILSNADIYYDESLESLYYVNWSLKFVISPTRYEHSNTFNSNILYGTNHNLHLNSPWLEPNNESIFSQDCWIFSENITINKNDCDFYLGITGCDNYITSIIIKHGYKIVGSSYYICVNHYDHLSENADSSKGAQSEIRETRIGTFKDYTFMKSSNIFIDKYTIEINNSIKDITNFDSKLCYLSQSSSSNKLSNKLLNCQYTSSSYTTNNESFKSKLNSNTYWQPNIDDKDKIITIKNNFLMKVLYIDIQGLPYNNSTNKENAYITKFRLICNSNGKNTNFKTSNIFEGINISNYGYIKRIYFDEPITCNIFSIQILEYHNRPCLRYEIYYDISDSIYDLDTSTHDFKNFVYNVQFLDKNRYLLDIDNQYNMNFFQIYNTKILSYPINSNYKTSNKYYLDMFSYNNINITEFWDCMKKTIFDNNFKVDKNILNEPINEGICLFTYIMNRRNNLENYIYSWLHPKINQIIILDWSSNQNNYDIIQQINDPRVLYIRVDNETTFIRTYAQNLAAKFCKYNKILKLDSDISITSNFFEKNILNQGEFIVGNYRCARDNNEKYTHGNIFLYLNDFFRINGYNEFVTTYGNDDADFSLRLQYLIGLKERIIDLDTLYHNPHDEEVRKKNMNTVYNTNVEIFKHRYYMDKVPLWNQYFKLNEFKIIKNEYNYYTCIRTTFNIYKFTPLINECEYKAINNVYEWYKYTDNVIEWLETDDIIYKKKFLSII